MNHPQDLSLREQAAAVRAGDLDPSELLSATFERIEERDGDLNSIVDRFPEQAERMLVQAREGSRANGPLYGVPVAVKDMFALPWRGPRDGTKFEHLPPGESGVFTRLRDAGAVIAGVTNMHLYGGGSTGHVSAYGPVGNPWDPRRCGGGSSGGSASAVGARLVAAAVGTDGGGSIRIPSAYCGITGMKATFGEVPPEGYTHAFSSVGAAGPMCRDAGDARLLGGVLLGRPLPSGEGRGLRAGTVASPFWEDLDPEVESACRDALGAAGWSSVELEMPGAEHTLIATVLRLTLETLPEMREEELEEADAVVRALFKYQLLLPAEGLVRADRVRSLLRRSTAAAFERCDVLVWPTVPAPAPPIENPTVEVPSGTLPADPANVRLTGFGNLTGLPGASVPVGVHSSGLPIGLQIQAPWGAESVVLDAAEHLEMATEREHVDAAPPVAAGAGQAG